MSIVAHFFKLIIKVIHGSGPIGVDRQPVPTAIVGFLFGPAGIGIYLQSWKDFFLCLGFLIGLFILIPGLGIVPGWLFSAFYGGYRVYCANN
ncbi:MAG: hypothetical protein JWQ57_4480 [Mucilaginibacter sp.]|nr:hypothetical protein [Mucilaginibacter sp.]